MPHWYTSSLVVGECGVYRTMSMEYVEIDFDLIMSGSYEFLTHTNCEKLFFGKVF